MLDSATLWPLSWGANTSESVNQTQDNQGVYNSFRHASPCAS
jgi:hypothetical protein